MTPEQQKLIDAAAEAICDAEFWTGHWATLEKDSNECAVYRKQAVSAVTVALRAARDVAAGTASYDDAVQRSAGCNTTGQRIANAIASLIPQEEQNDPR
jgi:hypothetical protein